jgi:hypothetical protein
MRILIDGDPMVYRAGFASQNDWNIIRWVDVIDEDDPEQDVEHDAHFAYKAELYEFIEYMNLEKDEYRVDIWVDPQPKSYCLKILNDSLKSAVRAIQGYLSNEDGPTDEVTVEVYLTGRTNFRNNVATIPGSFNKDGTAVIGYKANRKDSRRPYWYDAMREHMLTQWNAKLSEGMEADDALAIEQWATGDIYNPETIIATIDKDLLNVPGWHYNMLSHVDTFVTHKDAQVNFYKQLLTGDKTDNIAGCYRVGKKKADHTINDDMTEQEMYNAVLKVYKSNCEKFSGRHGDLSPEVSILENGRLLWMLQNKDQAWTPPGEDDESLTELGFMEFGEFE